MPWALLVLVGLLIWAGSALLIQAWLDRAKRPSLAERLAPFQKGWLADEAERWFRQQ